jgi:hypothetical protein
LRPEPAEATLSQGYQCLELQRRLPLFSRYHDRPLKGMSRTFEIVELTEQTKTVDRQEIAFFEGTSGHQ